MSENMRMNTVYALLSCVYERTDKSDPLNE